MSDSAPAGTPSSQGRSLIRVLVVDDSLAVRQYMQAKLPALSRDCELKIDLADSGEEALRKVSATAYDLVFLDVVMTGVDGHEVCRRIKQIRKTRVAMLSSLKSPQDHEAGRCAGCDNYLAKPPADADLQAVLRIVSLSKLIEFG